MKCLNNKVRPFLVILVATGLAACDTDQLLNVVDPDIVTPGDVVGEKGAELYWAGAVGLFAGAYSSGGGGTGGLLGNDVRRVPSLRYLPDP